MDLHGLCQEFASGHSSSDVPKVLAQGIQKKDIDLLKLVEALGVYLTSSDVDHRYSGTKLLVEVLTQLNLFSYKLPTEDVEYLAVFYCDRLKDRAILLPNVLAGLHAMVSHYHLSDEHVVLVCRAIFKEVHNQSLSQVDRSVVYSILEHFLVRHIAAIQAFGSEFVLGYIQAIDGERDPRNLLTIFTSVPIIIQKLPFETLAEDLFEVTSCYFPIDFTPPPNDPNTVSREALITSLRKCLTATPKFAEFCVPLLLEKLSSDILSAKLDSLLTLECGASVFGAGKLQPFLDSLWAALRKEMFMSSSAEVQVVCAKTLASVSSALSAPLHVSGHREDLVKLFIDKVVQDCQRYLREPGSKLIRPAVHTLCAAARGSDSACTYVLVLTMPLLLDQYKKSTTEGQRRTLLEAIHSFVGVVKDTASNEDSSPLAEFKDQLWDILLTSNQSQTSIVMITIAVIKDMIEIQGLLDTPQLTASCDYLKSLVTNSQDVSVREGSCMCLSALARCYPRLTRENLLSPLLKTTLDSSLVDPTMSRTIQILTSLSSHHDLLILTLPALVNFLSAVLSASTPDWGIAQCTAASLLSLVADHLTSDVCRSLLEGEEGVLVKLVCLCVRTSTLNEEYTCILASVAELVRRYSMVASDEAVLWFYDMLVKLLVCGESLTFSEGITLPKLDHKQPPEQTQLVCIVAALVSAAQKQVAVRYSERVVVVLLELASYCSHKTTSEQAARAYASIVNKLKEDSSLAALLEKDLLAITTLISDSDGEVEQRLRALNLWTWVTKALVMRSNAKGREMALKLLDLCGDGCGDVRREASEGFKVLLEDTQDLLNTQCHANVRLFYKQQLFMQVVPQIVQEFHTAEPDKQQYLLQSLSHFMQGVPKQVLLSELPKLLPLLLESLSSKEVGLIVSTLQGLLSLIQDTPLSVVEHVPTLVPRLLTLAQDKTSMGVRQAALKCIGALTALPTHSVYPYQSAVLRGLAPCLDDHKRLVRQDAVSTRSKWFLLGT